MLDFLTKLGKLLGQAVKGVFTTFFRFFKIIVILIIIIIVLLSIQTGLLIS